LVYRLFGNQAPQLSIMTLMQIVCELVDVHQLSSYVEQTEFLWLNYISKEHSYYKP